MDLTEHRDRGDSNSGNPAYVPYLVGATDRAVIVLA